MVATEARPRMPRFGIKVVYLNPVSLPSGLLWIIASLPGPPGFLDSSWCSLSLSRITHEDMAVWPNSVSIFLEFSSFLAALFWLQGAADFGKIWYFLPRAAYYV